MLKFAKIPLQFLFIGSLLGLFLRWQFLSPTPGVNYGNFLHAHSHVMFLGWVLNVLFLGFSSNHILEDKQKTFRNLLIILQVLVIGMLISFPLQGYGFYSIVFSTLHTLVAIVFIVIFFNRTKYLTATSAYFAKLALIFFLISTIGPFSLGYLMANQLEQSNWYYFSIYFYLHFQYNGFFLFGIFSLFFNLLEKRKININVRKIKIAGTVLAICVLPAYLLSILWAKPGYGYNIVAILTALIQLLALILLFVETIKQVREIKSVFSKSSILFLCFVLTGLIIKSLLQLLSGFPSVAQMAYELRPIVIAYLHLVLVGVISLSLLIWYVESGILKKKPGNKIIFVFLTSFLGMEICLVLSPWWSFLFGSEFLSASVWLFIFSLILSVCCFAFFISIRKNLTNVRL